MWAIDKMINTFLLCSAECTHNNSKSSPCGFTLCNLIVDNRMQTQWICLQLMQELFLNMDIYKYAYTWGHVTYPKGEGPCNLNRASRSIGAYGNELTYIAFSCRFTYRPIGISNFAFKKHCLAYFTSSDESVSSLSTLQARFQAWRLHVVINYTIRIFEKNWISTCGCCWYFASKILGIIQDLVKEQRLIFLVGTSSYNAHSNNDTCKIFGIMYSFDKLPSAEIAILFWR